MLGLSWKDFKIYYKENFVVNNNELYFINQTNIIKVPIFIKKTVIDDYFMYENFFRFENELDAFTYYKSFLDYDSILIMCKIYLEIYDLNKKIKLEKIQHLEELQKLDMIELRYLVNCKNNYTKNSSELKKIV